MYSKSCVRTWCVAATEMVHGSAGRSPTCVACGNAERSAPHLGEVDVLFPKGLVVGIVQEAALVGTARTVLGAPVVLGHGYGETLQPARIDRCRGEGVVGGRDAEE